MRKLLLPTASIWFLIVFISVISCGKNASSLQPQLDCSNVTNKNFATDVNPIVQSTCNQQGCHDVASTNGPGPLTNYTQLFSARAVVRVAIQSGLMPQNTTLTTAQRNSILCWIDSGAPNN
jgi:uncharacterized membrane protein